MIIGWFGGGADLTPYYLFDDDAIFFHNKYKTICDQYSSNLYPRFKTWCDDYFFIPARGEHRGIGGIFFDDLSSIQNIENINSNNYNNNNSNNNDSNNNDSNDNDSNKPLQKSLENKEIELDKAMKFTTDISNTFMDSYIPIIQKRKDLPYTGEQRHWQLLRRGRYIEFNMLYDRGVKVST